MLSVTAAQLDAWLAALMFPLGRLLGLFASAPVFSNRGVSVRVRLAIGIIWIILVPAEMLGVSAGLGYFILDARDRLAYSDLMAAILVIGFLGYLLDHAARSLHRRWLHA